MGRSDGADRRSATEPTARGEAGATEENDAPRPGLGVPRRRSAPVGSTIGGILVGFDEQVWRRQPPAQERVGQVDRARTIVAPSGLTVELPEGPQGDEPDRTASRGKDR